MDTDVVIVGGGIAGLSAAFSLQQRGVPFRLLEATDRWGGVVRTEVVSGFLLEAGPDAFIAQKPDAATLSRELGLGERLVPSNTTLKTVYILRRGRPVPMPEGLALGVPTRMRAFLRTPLVSWPAKLRMGLEPLLPRRRDGADESVADFFRRRLGREALENLGDPLISAIHGGDAARLSMRAVLPRFADMETRGSLLLGLWRAARKAPPAGAAFYAL
ncbi:MAG TPA: protoporphyrinogen oxidase, partial [Vicinamibacteria bacterium]|nr:protoporphyrinogen oxidase [Vicinamibacteria bacterium]